MTEVLSSRSYFTLFDPGTTVTGRDLEERNGDLRDYPLDYLKEYKFIKRYHRGIDHWFRRNDYLTL